MPIGDVLPEIALAVSAVGVLLTASFTARERHRWCALLALAALAAAAVLAARGAAPPHLSFQGTWAVDGATTAARLVIIAFAAISVGMAPGWMRSDRRHGEFYAVLLLSTLGAVLMAGAADTMELTVGVLLSSVTGFALAGYHRDWPLSVEAAMKYFLVGALSNVLLLTGVVVLFGLVGDTAYRATALALGPGGRAAGSEWAVLAAVSFLAVGLTYKLGAFPAYAWLPDVAEGAPAPSAAFLTVVPKIGALVALSRIVLLLPEGVVPWRILVAALAVATMTIGNLGALWQTDVRRLIGWSSVAQSGYALVAVVALGSSDLAWPALIFFLVGYGAANLAAFAVVTHLRGRTDVDDYRGLAAERPGGAAALAVSFLSLVGIPPLVGFVGKLAVFGAAVDAGWTWLAVVAVANTVVSLFYYLRVLGPAYFEERPGSRPAALGPWSRWTAGIAAVATVALGLAAEAVWPLLATGPLLP